MAQSLCHLSEKLPARDHLKVTPLPAVEQLGAGTPLGQSTGDQTVSIEDDLHPR